jgi:hypothetical protein
VRFLADMGVSPRVVHWLHEHGHDAVHLRDQGLHRAHVGSRFHRNRVDFAVEDERHRLSTPQYAYDHLIARLAVALENAAGALDAGAIVSVEDTRYRLRRLPVGH